MVAHPRRYPGQGGRRVLKVDADLYAAALARLLAEPILPVSLSAPVERMGTLLRNRQEQAGDHFDLSEALVRQVSCWMWSGRWKHPFPPTVDPEVDLALVAILRPLHRVLYTGLGPYHPDPAVSWGPCRG